MIVGGNIDHVTRTMTTAIALETSKGNIALALALGMILLAIALAINMALMGIRRLASTFRLCLILNPCDRWQRRARFPPRGPCRSNCVGSRSRRVDGD